jgi:uncharacterized protein DUF1573
MRILGIILVAAIIGGAVGGAVGYVEVRSDRDSLLVPGEAKLSPGVANEALPRLQVDEPVYKFDSMQRGTKKSHEFVIKNVGTAPLKVRAGTTSCKCTLSEVSEDPIPPGGTSHVKVEWTAKADSGPFTQTANILSNDPLHSTMELRVEGSIMTASGVEPPDLLFDKIPVGESRTAQVYVMAMLQDDLTVSDPVLSDASTRDKFDVKIEPVDPKDLPNKTAKKGVRISLTAKPGLPVGRFVEWLSLKTSLKDAETLEIPIVGQIVGDINVAGNTWSEDQGAVKLGSVRSSEGRKEKLSLMVRGEAAQTTTFKVESRDPEDLKVTIGEPRKLRDNLVQVPLEIEIPAGTRPMVRLDTAQGERGKIVLSTTHPKVKEMAIGVQFSVER